MSFYSNVNKFDKVIRRILKESEAYSINDCKYLDLKYLDDKLYSYGLSYYMNNESMYLCISRKKRQRISANKRIFFTIPLTQSIFYSKFLEILSETVNTEGLTLIHTITNSSKDILTWRSYFMNNDHVKECLNIKFRVEVSKDDFNISILDVNGRKNVNVKVNKLDVC